MLRNEILEYPFHGTIMRVISGKGSKPDTEVLLYDGVMDEHMMTYEQGHTLQTSAYIISIPLVKKQALSNDGEENDIPLDVVYDDGSEWIIPRKGDKISITRYGETFKLTVDNSEPSQLGGISIYATRNSW